MIHAVANVNAPLTASTARTARNEVASTIMPMIGGDSRNAKRINHVTIVRPLPVFILGMLSAAFMAIGTIAEHPAPARTIARIIVATCG